MKLLLFFKLGFNISGLCWIRIPELFVSRQIGSIVELYFDQALSQTHEIRSNPWQMSAFNFHCFLKESEHQTVLSRSVSIVLLLLLMYERTCAEEHGSKNTQEIQANNINSFAKIYVRTCDLGCVFFFFPPVT